MPILPELAHLPPAARLTLQQLAPALRRARLARGMTLRAAAASARLHYARLCKVEQGHALPSLPQLYALAHTYRVEVGALLDEDE